MDEKTFLRYTMAMHVEHLQWTPTTKWSKEPSLARASLVIYFASQSALAHMDCYTVLRGYYPSAQIIGCSTGGEIFGASVHDASITVAAMQLTATPIQPAHTTITSSADSFAAGQNLAQTLQRPDLRYVFLLSDGIHVNGSDLVRGIYDILPEHVRVTGGLAGDGADFKNTVVGLNAAPQSHQVAAIGFYGDALQIGSGCVSGWRPYAQSRTITRSSGNILYELDGKPALDLYKIYLGEDAKNLPGSALLYPLNIRPDIHSEHDMVRTIVGVNEEEKSLIFAGDMPNGYIVRFMRGPMDQLIEGAANAAELAVATPAGKNSLAILVSCIGRKLLLGKDASKEAAAAARAFKNPIPTIGFYSYGEICHQEATGTCSLHNQTMTITVLQERSSTTEPFASANEIHT